MNARSGAVRGARFGFSVVAVGCGAMVGQLLLMREIIVAFYGNELSLGAILASWLLWVGVGSGIGARVVGALVRSRLAAYAAAQSALALLVPLSLLAARMIKSALRVGPGEVVGMGPMFLSSFLLLAPLCVAVGMTFALGCRLAGDGGGEVGDERRRDDSQGIGDPGAAAARRVDEREKGRDAEGEIDGRMRRAAADIGRVYYLEASGSVIAGVAFSFLIIRFLPALTTALIVLLLNALAVIGLLAVRWRARLVYPLVFVGLAGVGWILHGTGIVARVDSASLRRQWAGFELLEAHDSIYGQVVVVGDERQQSLFESGLLVFTHPDRASAEEAVHFALLEHPRPKQVLLIGGGAGGSLTEVLKHGVESVDYVELDPTIISTARRFFGPDLAERLDDPRVRIIEGDGRWFVKRTDKRYDVVILDLPEPYTAQINRFYTREFFAEVLRILDAGGIFGLRIGSAENYIPPELARLLRSLEETMASVFEDVLVLPGENSIFLAATDPGVLTADYGILSDRIEDRRLETLYVAPHSLPFRLEEERIGYLERSIAGAPIARLNTDLHPISYYYDMILWSSRFQSGERAILERLTGIALWQVALGLLIVTAGLVVVLLRVPATHGIGVLAPVGTTGAAEIVFEVIALLSFQIIYGYVYARLGVILAAFMLGLVLGSLVSARRLAGSPARWRSYVLNQCLITLYPLIFLGILFTLVGSSAGVRLFAAAELVIPLLTAGAGFLGGVQFPLAVALYLDLRPGARHVGGFTYAIDLSGAAGGALLASAVALPLLGIPGTLVGVFLLNSCALVWIIVTAVGRAERLRAGKDSAAGG
jgi:spermidine synthase